MYIKYVAYTEYIKYVTYIEYIKYIEYIIKYIRYRIRRICRRKLDLSFEKSYRLLSVASYLVYTRVFWHAIQKNKRRAILKI